LYSSISLDSNCSSCHGGSLIFSDDQRSVEDLVSAVPSDTTSCYSCHWAYPHIAYDYGSSTDVWTTEGTMTGDAHIYYLIRSPLFVDSLGRRPHPDDPVGVVNPAIENTCGGSAGNCHFNGDRSTSREYTRDLCNSYCHKPEPTRTLEPVTTIMHPGPAIPEP
jgi:hypothetical protein